MPLTMKRMKLSPTQEWLLEVTFAEQLCTRCGVPIDTFSELVWRLCSSWLTRCLRPLILRITPHYFQADDACLDLVADCRRRWEIVDAVHILRVSYLRHGFWRYLGIGLNGEKLLKLVDKIAACPNDRRHLKTARVSILLPNGGRDPANFSDEY